MPELPTHIFERIGKVLHEGFDEIVRERMPERWTDLINRLNADERLTPAAKKSAGG